MSIDSPATERDGEALPRESLEPWLRQNLPQFDGNLQVSQFRKGHSNLTYLISDGTREWVLRRPPFGTQVKTAHDMGREFRILSRLHAAYAPAPQAICHCDDAAIIGAPFYVMDRVRGVILRDRIPAGFSFTPEFGAQLAESFVQNLATIHAVDLSAAGLEDLGRGQGYIERQVRGWTERYAASRTDDIPEMHEVSAWLAEKMPADGPAVLIHNDYKYDNIVLDTENPTKIIGVLDWEMATVGHPLMDLGTTLGYWVTADDSDLLKSMPFGVQNFPGTFSREKLVARYGEITGRNVSDIDFFHVYGLFKIAVVAQQIYYRFATGKTTDARFQMMIMGVRLLSGFAAEIISKSKL